VIEIEVKKLSLWTIFFSTLWGPVGKLPVSKRFGFRRGFLMGDLINTDVRKGKLWIFRAEHTSLIVWAWGVGRGGKAGKCFEADRGSKGVQLNLLASELPSFGGTVE